MSLRISLYVLTSFVISFSVFSYVMFLPINIKAETPLPENIQNYIALQEGFFSRVDKLEDNVFIFGSSYIMGLNTTQIHDKIKQNTSDYRVYNLAIFGDSIQKRSKIIDSIIAAKPEVVVYGIAEDDFADPVPANTVYTKPISILPDPHEFFDQGIRLLEERMNLDYPDSPKTVTWLTIRQLVGTRTDLEKFSPYPDSPFMKITKANTITISDLELKNLVNYAGEFGQIKKPEDNQHLKTLKKMLLKLEENDIRVVLFVVPHHSYLLEKSPPEYENNFRLVIDDLQQQGFSTYERDNNYSRLKIWHDLTHVAVNPDAQIFSDDVAQMILDVIQ